MHNGSCDHGLPPVFRLQESCTRDQIISPSTLPSPHGNLASHWMQQDVMFLLHALTSLSFLLFLLHFFFFLAARFLITYLHLKATFKNTRDDHVKEHPCDDECIRWREEGSEKEDAVAGIAGGEEGMLFWFDECVLGDDSLLNDGVKNSDEKPCLELEVEKVFPADSPPRVVHSGTEDGREKDDAGVTDASATPDHRSLVISASEDASVGDKDKQTDQQETEDGNEEKKNSSGDHVKFFVNNGTLMDTKKLLLEDARHDDHHFGESLTSESTSKSSAEWRSSTITKDSETEYPFSSSSRRSSSLWETYTLFRKYDEDMIYFHKVGAQKLNETESFRSVKHQPRSISERIVHKLTAKQNNPIGIRDPYKELESAYVAQICLTWEALNWNYSNFCRLRADKDMADRGCPARVAQEFQQFQVLLQRFIENEPFEYGRRPEVFARMKNSSPKLLLVPEFREVDDDKDDLISSTQFQCILEDSIRTFMNFLCADKRSRYRMFKDMINKRSSSVDQTLVNFLKKANKKKKTRLKDLTRRQRCLKRRKLGEEEEMEILVGLIDMKIVSRVLRMIEITEEQLHWCEQKMTRVRIGWDGKIHRDPSPLFFPVN